MWNSSIENGGEINKRLPKLSFKNIQLNFSGLLKILSLIHDVTALKPSFDHASFLLPNFVDTTIPVNTSSLQWCKISDLYSQFLAVD